MVGESTTLPAPKGTNTRPGSPTGAHRNPPRIAPPDSWPSLRDARVPPVDSVDDPSTGGTTTTRATKRTLSDRAI
jgi:hypothetical protein